MRNTSVLNRMAVLQQIMKKINTLTDDVSDVVSPDFSSLAG